MNDDENKFVNDFEQLVLDLEPYIKYLNSENSNQYDFITFLFSRYKNKQKFTFTLSVQYTPIFATLTGIVLHLRNNLIIRNNIEIKNLIKRFDSLKDLFESLPKYKQENDDGTYLMVPTNHTSPVTIYPDIDVDGTTDIVNLYMDIIGKLKIISDDLNSIALKEYNRSPVSRISKNVDCRYVISNINELQNLIESIVYTYKTFTNLGILDTIKQSMEKLKNLCTDNEFITRYYNVVNYLDTNLNQYIFENWDSPCNDNRRIILMDLCKQRLLSNILINNTCVVKEAITLIHDLIKPYNGKINFEQYFEPKCVDIYDTFAIINDENAKLYDKIINKIMSISHYLPKNFNLDIIGAKSMHQASINNYFETGDLIKSFATQVYHMNQMCEKAINDPILCNSEIIKQLNSDVKTLYCTANTINSENLFTNTLSQTEHVSTPPDLLLNPYRRRERNTYNTTLNNDINTRNILESDESEDESENEDLFV